MTDVPTKTYRFHGGPLDGQEREGLFVGQYLRLPDHPDDYYALDVSDLVDPGGPYDYVWMEKVVLKKR